MNAVYARQKALAEALTAAGLPTDPVTPPKKAPPFRYVLLSGVDVGQAVGSYLATFQVVCVVKPSQSNDRQVQDATDMAVAVVNVVEQLDGFAVTSPVIGQPGIYAINGQQSLAVAVSVTARITRAQMKG